MSRDPYQKRAASSRAEGAAARGMPRMGAAAGMDKGSNTYIETTTSSAFSTSSSAADDTPKSR